MIFNLSALQERTGLEMMFGGGTTGAVLAEHMGPDKDIAKTAGENEILLCINCGTEKLVYPARLLES